MPFKFFDSAQSRLTLTEGRTRGLGFAFAQLKNGDELHAVHPISCCKDYLSDIIYSERTGRPYTIYGLTTAKLGLFEVMPGYLVMRINQSMRSTCSSGWKVIEDYVGMDKDIAALEANHPNMQLMVNWLEEKLGLTERTKIEKIGPNLFVCHLPNFWTEYCYRISLLSFLVRVSMAWDGKGEALEFIRTIKGEDAYFVGRVLPNIQALIKGTKVVQDMTRTGFNPHDSGIYSLKLT